MTKIILALDLATRTGYAIGVVGEPPRSASVILKSPRQSAEFAFGNMIAWMQRKIEEERPEIIFKEAPLHLAAFAKRVNSEKSVHMQLGLHAIVDGVANRYGIETKSIHENTIRKHFIGQANCGDRKSTKHAVIRRCHLLGLMDQSSWDDNRADAIALFDFASATFGGTFPSHLVMFEEAAKRVRRRRK